MNKADFLWKTINRYDYYIGTTNTKAGFLIAWNIFVFGTAIVAGNETAKSTAPVGWNILPMIMLLWFTLVITLISLWLTFRVVQPLLKSPNFPAGFHSTVFFDHAAAMIEEKYHEQMVSLADDEIVRDLSYQVNTLATGTREKFVNLKWAIRLILYGQIPMIIINISLWSWWIVSRVKG